uniref:Uncharacterized protein n=1 Tax=Strongyloides papillosus TaxID=174720 RepID=A0A0N5BV61_STREA
MSSRIQGNLSYRNYIVNSKVKYGKKGGKCGGTYELVREVPDLALYC